MNIGLITIQKAPNYGACLQTYALYHFLEQEGHKVEIIDLYRPDFKGYKKSKKYKPASIYRDEELTHKIKRYIKILIGREKNNNSHPISTKKCNLLRAEKKINEFCCWIKYSRPYKSPEELYDNPPRYDAYITGSDQVWNPTQNYCIEPYFLTFAPKGSNKLSYASSIGISELTWKEKRKFKKWISQYTAISVREKRAALLLESLTYKSISVVADPTFLIPQEYWKSIIKLPPYKGYILIFTLQKDLDFINYGKSLAAESGKELVIMGLDYDDYIDENGFTLINDAGVEEFLGFINNAELVITDSFHCTVFSLILGVKNMFSYIYPWNKRGSRITELLDTFGISNHLLDVDLCKSYNELMKLAIDSSEIDAIIEQQRNHSIDFLRSNLK